MIKKIRKDSDLPTAEDILADAKKEGRGKKGKGYTCDVCDVYLYEIDILMDANADVVSINEQTEGGTYFTEVIYKEHHFVFVCVNRVKEWD